MVYLTVCGSDNDVHGDLSLMKPPKYICEFLRDGEKLLWYGQPRQGFVWYRWDCLTVFYLSAMMMVSVTVGLVAWYLQGLGRATWIAFGICSLAPIILVGRLYTSAFFRRHTHYIVTDQRVAIQYNTILDRRVQSIEFRPGFKMTAVDESDRLTTIYFGDYDEPLEVLSGGFLFPPPAFYYLEQPGVVTDIIDNARRR